MLRCMYIAYHVHCYTEKQWEEFEGDYNFVETLWVYLYLCVNCFEILT
jgi:hypothetical protein